VRRIIAAAHGRAHSILMAKREKLTLIAERLLENEVLDRQDFLKLMDAPAPA
jgi:ATP-dependent Zn protease